MEELGERAVKQALRLGASEAEAYIRKARVTRVEFAEEIETIKVSESIGVNVRVALGRRVASHSTSILSEDEIVETAAQAVRIARVAPEDPDWRHLNRRFGAGLAEGYFDPAVRDLHPPEIVEALTPALDAMKGYDRRVKPTRGVLVVTASATSVTNSYGEHCLREGTYVSVWMRAKAEEAGLKGTGTEHQQSRFWREVDLEGLALKAAERAVKFLRAKPIPSGRMPAILANKVFASILGVLLSGPVSADWVQKGRSPLAGRLGAQIASKAVCIVDDGTLRGGWGTKPFDDEGHPTQRTIIVDKGILQGYLYDTYTSLKAGVDSTGNAQRPRYWMRPRPLPNNLILEAGDASPEEMIHETGRGLYVEDTIGEWLSNPVSGLLNATVTHGFLIEGGELTQPVKGVVISGPFYELLRDGIELVGNDVKNSMQYYAPTVKFAQLTVAGV